MNNVFLHLHPVRVRQHAVKFAYTFCLGGLSFFLFLVLTVTGVYLMFFYVPSATQAYSDILQIQSQVPFGLLTRNIHRWAAHLMVFFVFLHMMRVFYHGAYKPPREFNWVVGVVLLFLTLMLCFTGYLLPWDQIAYWAITIGSNMAGYAPLFNTPSKTLLLGGTRGERQHVAALLRSPHHGLPVGRGGLPGRPLLAHPQGRRHRAAMTPSASCRAARSRTWLARGEHCAMTETRRRRPSGASSCRWTPPRRTEIDKQRVPMSARPYRLLALVKQDAVVRVQKEPDDTVMTWPHLLAIEFLAAVFMSVFLLFMGLFVNAPLEELANANVTPEVAKAPWYFLGLQELLAYFHPTVAGALVPPLRAGRRRDDPVRRSREHPGRPALGPQDRASCSSASSAGSAWCSPSSASSSAAPATRSRCLGQRPPLQPVSVP